MLTVAVAQFSSYDNAIHYHRYVLSLLWMTSCLLVVGQAKVTLTGRIFKMTHQGQHRRRSLISVIALFDIVSLVDMHHCPQMSKRLCSSEPVQRPTVHWSASDRHVLCQPLLEVLRSRTAIGDWSFSIAGPRVCNTLPASVRDTNSSLRFRKLLKAFLFV